MQINEKTRLQTIQLSLQNKITEIKIRNCKGFIIGEMLVSHCLEVFNKLKNQESSDTSLCLADFSIKHESLLVNHVTVILIIRTSSISCMIQHIFSQLVSL